MGHRGESNKGGVVFECRLGFKPKLLTIPTGFSMSNPKLSPSSHGSPSLISKTERRICWLQQREAYSQYQHDLIAVGYVGFDLACGDEWQCLWHLNLLHDIWIFCILSNDMAIIWTDLVVCIWSLELIRFLMNDCCYDALGCELLVLQWLVCSARLVQWFYVVCIMIFYVFWH